LESLKSKFSLIENEEKATVEQLKRDLEKLRHEYQMRVKIRQ